MKTIIINDNNLKDEEIERKVVRVKGLLLNSKGKIMLVHNNNTYQFPGGHKEETESLKECMLREMEEETGISLEIEEEPYLCITTYSDNYFNSGKKVLSQIYYYRLFTDSNPDFSKVHLDELEIQTDFELFYIPFNDLEEFLHKNINSGTMDSNIGREMLYAVEEYNKLFGGI